MVISALPTAVLVFVALAVAGLAGDVPPARIAALSVIVAAIVVVVALTVRRVLRRPQAVAAADVLAADDAIRSRSLHAVTAAGATLVLYCAFDLLLRVVGAASAELAAALLLAGAVGVPWIGRRLATSRWVVPSAAVPA